MGIVFMNVNTVVNFYKKYGSNLFQSILTGIDNSLVFVFNKKPSRAPLYVGWLVTHKCNSECGYCTSWEIGKSNKKPELSFQESLELVRQLGRLKTWMLSFTGGEPLLKKNIYKLISEAKKYKIGTNVNTNGFLLEKYAEQIIDSGLDTLTVSIESHDSAVHDKVRVCEDSFARAELGIKKIISLREQRGIKKPYVMIRANVSKRNYEDLDKFFKYWNDKVDEVLLQPIHDGSDTSIFQIKADEISFDDADKFNYKKYMKKLFNKYPNLNSKYYQEFYNFFFNTEKMREKYRCFSSYFSVTIDPYGNILSCPEHLVELGNIKKTPLLDILNNEKSVKFKNELKQHKNKCFCWYNCTGPINQPLTTLFKPFK
jgi:radical SAM protein with 4Fe4S-binding SPASM domain